MTSALSKNPLANKICPWLTDSLEEFESINKENRLAHGWLISGQAGIGKLNLSLAIANRILNSNADWPQLLDSKEAEAGMSARHEPQDNHPDLHLISPEEGKRTISVDCIKGNKQKNIKGISEVLQLTSHEGNAKVAILEDADGMTKEAANSLLKTLEEPSQNTYLFLLAQQPGRLPSTIRSRCQLLSVQRPSSKDALEWVGGFDPAISHADWSILLDLAGNAPIQTLRFYKEGFLKKSKEYLDLLGKISTNKLDPQKVADQWIKEDLELALTWFTRQLKKGIHIQLSDRRPEIIDASSKASSLEIFNRIEIKKLFQIYDKSEYLIRSLGGGVNAELALKALLLEFQAAIEG